MTLKSHTQGRSERDGAIETIKETDLSYQDRKGFNALHYICTYFQGDSLFQIIELFSDLGTNVVRYSIAMYSNGVGDVIKAHKIPMDGLHFIIYVDMYKQ